jgi:hypothetical protein
MRNITISLTKQIVIYPENVLVNILQSNPEEFIEANKRGKFYGRSKKSDRENARWEKHFTHEMGGMNGWGTD